MRKIFRLRYVAFLFAMSVACFTAAQNDVEPQGNIILLEPLMIENLFPLSFGKLLFSSSDHAGTCVLSPLGEVSVSSGLVLANHNQTPAFFKIWGQSLHSFFVTVPMSIELTDESAKHNIKVDNITVSINNGSISTGLNRYSGTFSSVGYSFMSLGGTLNVVSDQQEGTYTGSFDVSVIYD